MGWMNWDHFVNTPSFISTKTCYKERQIFDRLGCGGRRKWNVSQQAAPLSRRGFCGIGTILCLSEGLEQEFLAASWKARLNEEHLHPFQACALISVPQPRAFQSKKSVGGDAGEGRGAREQRCKKAGLGDRCRGGKEDLGIKCVSRIHPLTVAFIWGAAT